MSINMTEHILNRICKIFHRIFHIHTKGIYSEVLKSTHCQKACFFCHIIESMHGWNSNCNDVHQYMKVSHEYYIRFLFCRERNIIRETFISPLRHTFLEAFS